MKAPKPTCRTTRVVEQDDHVWVAASFDDFLQELDHLRGVCETDAPLYRGHADYRWLLDSVFVRNVKRGLFRIPSGRTVSREIKLSRQYGLALLYLFLVKFRFANPSRELLEREGSDGTDAWFEFLKRMQQHPEEENHPSVLRGSFLVDWSLSADIAMYFATLSRRQDGALWVFDPMPTGNVKMTLKVIEILERMDKDAQKLKGALGLPVIFHPPRQYAYPREKAQEAIYVAQIDMRVTLEEIWKAKEAELQAGQRIFVRLLLPSAMKSAAAKYLRRKGITRAYLFPDLARPAKRDDGRRKSAGGGG